MAITIRPELWLTTSSYAIGDRVTYNGVGYEAIVATTPTDLFPSGNSNWEVFAVFEILDYYSLQEMSCWKSIIIHQRFVLHCLSL